MSTQRFTLEFKEEAVKQVVERVLGIDGLDLQAETILRMEHRPGQHQQLDARADDRARGLLEFRQAARSGRAPNHRPGLGNRLAAAIALGQLQVDMAAPRASTTSTKVHTPLENAWATALATPLSSKRQFLPLLAGAEAGRETQAPETTSLIYAQRIYPRPGVLA